MKRFLLIIAVFIFSIPSFSQTEDLGSWMTFSLDKGLGDKFGFSFDQELRLKNNLTDINLVYSNFGFNYKAAKFLKISAVYRFIAKQKNDGAYGIRNRFYTDFSFKFKPGNWTLGYRARLQGEWRTAGYHSDLGNVPEVFLRNLFKVGYKAGDHFSPYVATELRWQLQNPKLPWGNGFDRERYIIGTDYKINDKNTAGFYFLLQKEFNVNDPQTLYIIGLEYSISID
jgi:hypothetical protein